MVFTHLHVIETLFKFQTLKRSENVSSLILVGSAFHQLQYSYIFKDMVTSYQEINQYLATDLVDFS